VCTLAKQGSYGLQDQTRKGGSDEGEEKPEKRACEGLSTEGGIFLGDVYAIRMENILPWKLITGGKIRGFLVKFCMGQLPGESTVGVYIVWPVHGQTIS
jgi:hypothetical protein